MVVVALLYRRQKLGPAPGSSLADPVGLFKSDTDSAWDSLSLNFVEPHTADLASVSSGWDCDGDSYYASLEAAIAAQAKGVSFANGAFATSPDPLHQSRASTRTQESVA